MANYYNWNIKSMDTIPVFDGYNDFVTRIFWDYIGTDDSNGVTAKVEGYTEWNVVNKENFVSYDNITLEVATLWLEDYNNLLELQSIITKKINDIINPPVVNLPLPWITTTTTTIPEPSPTTTTTTEPPPPTTTTTTEQI